MGIGRFCPKEGVDGGLEAMIPKRGSLTGTESFRSIETGIASIPPKSPFANWIALTLCSSFWPMTISLATACAG